MQHTGSLDKVKDKYFKLLNAISAVIKIFRIIHISRDDGLNRIP